MKTFLLLFSAVIIACSTSIAQAPDWLWAKSMGGTSYDLANDIAIDASGNVYTTGVFQGTVDFDPSSGTFNLTNASTSYADIFISKLDGMGNFVWAKALGGAGNNDIALSIILDPTGSSDIYITGFFYGTADFDPGAGTFNLTSVGQDDIFISKIDSMGNFEWAKAIGGVGTDRGTSIATDASGNVYITGFFDGTVDFDPGFGTFILNSVAWDIFIVRLENTGNFVWAKRMGGMNSDQGLSISINPAGNGDVFITGTFVGTADFDPDSSTSFNLTSNGGIDIFVSKINSSGNFVWAKSMGGIDQDFGYSLAIDPVGNDNVYITGTFLGTADFDPGASTFNLTSLGNEDIFISKLDSSGNFVWAKRIGAIDQDLSLSISIDPTGKGDIYNTGYFRGITDFDPGSSGNFNLSAVGATDIFILKLDSSGNFVWAKAIGGSYWDEGRAIALDNSGNVHVVGDFYSPSISFGSTILTNAGASDIFIAKLDTAMITWQNEIENFGNGIYLYPNPATSQLEISSKQFAINSIEIYDALGQKVFSQQQTIPIAIWNKHRITIDVSQLNAGIYFLKMQTDDFLKTEKLIVTK